MYAQGAGESVINARPSETFRSASTWGHSAFEYDQKALEQALPELIAAYDDYQDSETFHPILQGKIRAKAQYPVLQPNQVQELSGKSTSSGGIRTA